MGGGHEDPEAGGKTMGHAPSGPLPTSEPPHLRGQDPGQYQYGTFHPPPVGYPQPAPPPGFGGGYQNQQQPHQPPYAHAEPYHAQGYQAVPGSERYQEEESRASAGRREDGESSSYSPSYRIPPMLSPKNLLRHLRHSTSSK